MCKWLDFVAFDNMNHKLKVPSPEPLSCQLVSRWCQKGLSISLKVQSSRQQGCLTLLWEIAKDWELFSCIVLCLPCKPLCKLCKLYIQPSPLPPPPSLPPIPQNYWHHDSYPKFSLSFQLVSCKSQGGGAWYLVHSNNTTNLVNNRYMCYNLCPQG